MVIEWFYLAIKSFPDICSVCTYPNKSVSVSSGSCNNVRAIIATGPAREMLLLQTFIEKIYDVVVIVCGSRS